MFFTIGITKPFVYLKDDMQRERYLIDDFGYPKDLTIPYGDSNTLMVSAGTLHVIRPFSVIGVLVILN
jgi:hypothetical protein